MAGMIVKDRDAIGGASKPARIIDFVTPASILHDMAAILAGPMSDQIHKLDSQGQLLSDSSDWSGDPSHQFCAGWPPIHAALVEAQQALAELRAEINECCRGILSGASSG